MTDFEIFKIISLFYICSVLLSISILSGDDGRDDPPRFLVFMPLMNTILGLIIWFGVIVTIFGANINWVHAWEIYDNKTQKRVAAEFSIHPFYFWSNLIKDYSDYIAIFLPVICVLTLFLL